MIKSISYLTVLSSLLFLSGCFQPVNITEECINGVVYYNGYHKMSPAYDREGNVILCDTESQDKTVD